MKLSTGSMMRTIALTAAGAAGAVALLAVGTSLAGLGGGLAIGSGAHGSPAGASQPGVAVSRSASADPERSTDAANLLGVVGGQPVAAQAAPSSDRSTEVGDTPSTSHGPQPGGGDGGGDGSGGSTTPPAPTPTPTPSPTPTSASPSPTRGGGEPDDGHHGSTPTPRPTTPSPTTTRHDN